MIEARIEFASKEALAAAKRFPVMLPQAASKALRLYLWRVSRYAQVAKFSGPGGATNSLKVQTGNARASVGQSPRVLSEGVSRVTGEWGAEPLYVRKHEFGGTYTEQVPAHLRRRANIARLARRSGIAAREFRTARALMIPVRAHTRTVTYRARHMVRDSVIRTRPILERYLRNAVRHLLIRGRVPSNTDVTGGN